MKTKPSASKPPATPLPEDKDATIRELNALIKQQNDIITNQNNVISAHRITLIDMALATQNRG